VASLADLIELGDLDELVREVDRRAERGNWDGLVELRDRCRVALERGKQLWPAASLAEYRLALEAPARWAGTVVVEGAGRFALGPLPEVAASTHTWADLAPHVPAGPLAAVTAHERVVRGDDLRDDPTVDRRVLELPLRLEPWEPDYPVATYHPDSLDAPMPELPPMRPVDLPPPAVESTSDADEPRALYDLVATWTKESDGRCRAVGVRGDARRAVATLAPARARMGELDARQALALMAWAAASGGAHGHRRGMVWGRYLAWEAAGRLAGFTRGDHLHQDAGALGAAIGDLRWHWWDDGGELTGWQVRLAVEDPAEGLAWAVVASDPG
jgi:hypothetical protein